LAGAPDAACAKAEEVKTVTRVAEATASLLFMVDIDVSLLLV
jgi:hypothetical protein